MLITSNRNISEWGSVFGDAVVATAILDRLVHHSHVITIRGDSYRLRAKRRSGLLQKATAPSPPARSRHDHRGGQFLVSPRGRFRVSCLTAETSTAAERLARPSSSLWASRRREHRRRGPAQIGVPALGYRECFATENALARLVARPARFPPVGFPFFEASSGLMAEGLLS